MNETDIKEALMLEIFARRMHKFSAFIIINLRTSVISFAYRMCSSTILRFLTLLCVLSMAITETYKHEVANKYFLDKQKFLLEIFHRVEEPTLNKVFFSLGVELVQDKASYWDYNDYMRKFYHKFLHGELLPQAVYISPLFCTNSVDFLGLYYFLYNARDWDTLSSNICWARIHVNPSLFVFTVTLAMIRRDDFRGLLIPKIQEILPQHFFTQPFILQAEKFDFASWSRWQSLENDSDGKIYKKMHALPWQWWHLLGIKERIQKSTGKYLMPFGAEENIRNSSSWSLAMDEVNIFWQPVDYSRNIKVEESKRELSYLTEDVGWNAYWYYLNMNIFAASLDQEKNANKHLDWWFWNLQQLLMRYRLERFENNLEDIKHVSEAFEPYLLTWNGERYKALTERQQTQIMDVILQIQDEVLRATIEETFVLKSGARLDLWKKAHLEEYLSRIFGTDLINFFRSIFDAGIPQLLHNFETMLREPNFYYYASLLLREYRKLREHFQICDIGRLQLIDLNITNAYVSSLETFMEIADNDVSNLLSNKHFYYAGQFLWQKTLQARQQRLNHKDFIIRLNVTANKPQKVVIRTFLLPYQDNFFTFGNTFYQLDAFFANLEVGLNDIKWHSKDFRGAEDTIGYTEFYRFINLALNDKFDFPLNLTRPNCGFPHRLLLPRGSFEGLPIKIFYIITASTGQILESSCDLYNNIGGIPDFSYSCDFATLMANKLSNVYSMDARIYHEEKLFKII